MIRENNKFNFKPPKGKKFNILQKLSRSILFAFENPLISFLLDHPKTSHTKLIT